MDFNDIDYPYAGHVFVWVKPAEGKKWDDIIQDSRSNSNRGDEFRPAKIDGTNSNPEDKGTQLDSRRITLIGEPYGYRLENFECGGELTFEDTPTLKI